MLTDIDQLPELDTVVAVVDDVAAAEKANVLVELKAQLGEADHVHVREENARVGLVPVLSLVDPLDLVYIQHLAVGRAERTLQMDVIGVLPRNADCVNARHGRGNMVLLRLVAADVLLLSESEKACQEASCQGELSQVQLRARPLG